MDAMLVIFIIVAIFVIAFVSSGFKIIQQAETMVIERLGKYNRTLESGINIILPLIDKPRGSLWRYRRVDASGRIIITQVIKKKIDLREQVFDFPRQNVITKDNVTIEIDAMLYFQITDPVRSTYEIANLPNAIEKLTQTTLRNVIGELDLDGCLVSRDIINLKLRGILDEATDKWGVKVNRVELQDITPPADIQKAMELQMRAERDRRAKILEAEGKKKAAILEAEGIKESDINKAEGAKQAAILRAEGTAEARIKIAIAEKEAIDKITEAILVSKGDPANYLIAVRYIETLKEMVSGKNNKVIYMPYEATAVLSSIGGIKDMLSGTGSK
ncbi:SPFH/Band 7/PHB domain protein [bacterium]|nr:SPFH/Band 7/PHB domain protein [bacterium]